jgi:hypothetical protein
MVSVNRKVPNDLTQALTYHKGEEQSASDSEEPHPV